MPEADSSGSPGNAVEADAADSKEDNSEADNAAADDVPAGMEEMLSRSNGGSGSSLAAEAPSKAAEVEPGQPSGGDADAERGADKEEEGGNIGMENGGEQQDMDRTAAAASTSRKVSRYSLFALPNMGILHIVIEKILFCLLASSASKL